MLKNLPPPNRVAVYLVSLAGLLSALAVPLADLDTQSVVGVTAGLASIVAVVDRWLKGWQQHASRPALDPAARARVEKLLAERKAEREFQGKANL